MMKKLSLKFKEAKHKIRWFKNRWKDLRKNKSKIFIRYI